MQTNTAILFFIVNAHSEFAGALPRQCAATTTKPGKEIQVLPAKAWCFPCRHSYYNEKHAIRIVFNVGKIFAVTHRPSAITIASADEPAALLKEGIDRCYWDNHSRSGGE
jgi:hypothetical protein